MQVDNSLGMFNSVISGETMKDYILSVHQITGDRYYNKREYSKALACYEVGLTILESRIGEVPEMMSSITFCDQYVHALSDFLITQCQVVNKFVIDSNQISTEKLLEDLSSYGSILTSMIPRLYSMNEAWENIRNEKILHTKSKQITTVYTLLAEKLELLSDLWFATADEVGSAHPDYERLLNQSCRAMKLAIENKSKLPESITIEMHCGYLNLLEQLYHFRKDENNKQGLLVDMKNHLERYQLLLVIQDNPITQLELISYTLLIDVKLHRISNNDAIARGHAIVASITERSPDNEKVISDFAELVDLSARLRRPVSLPISSSSSSWFSSSVSQKPQKTDSIRIARTSLSSSSEIQQTAVKKHPLSSIVQLISRNPDLITQVIDKIYSIGFDEFSRLYPESPITTLSKNYTQTRIKYDFVDDMEQLDDADKLNLLIPALEYIARDYLKQTTPSQNEVTKLYKEGKPWQSAAVRLSLKIQTAIRSIPFASPGKRSRVSSTSQSSLLSSPVLLPENQVLPTESNKRSHALGDSKQSGVKNTDYLPQSAPILLSHEDHVLAQWNNIQQVHVSTVSQNQFLNANLSLFSNSELDSSSALASIAGSSSDTIHSDLEKEYTQIAPVLDLPDFVASHSFFAPSSENEKTQNDLNDSHHKVFSFIHAMKSIKSNVLQPRLEKRLLANLLTIMGEFLEVAPDSPITLRIAVVLSVESLYKTALVIYPAHELASKMLKSLHVKNSSMFRNRHHFVSLSDDLEVQSDKKHFEDAIESLFNDLETIYLTKPEQIGPLVNALFKFMTRKIHQFKLMSAEELFDLIEVFYNYVIPTVGCSSCVR
jgi:hypothetical protein